MSFRAKIFIALLGLVAGLTGLLFVMVGQETERQVDLAVSEATMRAQNAFSDLEELWRAELSRVGARFTGSNRIPGALEAALEEDDSEVLADAANYELTIAGIADSLLVVADAEGSPVLALVNGAESTWNAGLPNVDDIVADDDEFFSYRIHEDRLFVVHAVPLALFGRLLGSMLVGYPVDREVIHRLGEVIGAEVCFVAGGRSLGATAGISNAALFDDVVALATADRLGTRILADRGWALAAEPLTVGEGVAGSRVIAVPLDEVVAPFERLRRRLAVAGATALFLALAIGVAVARGLASPVGVLTRATERVAEGDLEVQVPVRTRDELGRLGQAFNQMVNDLALKEKYRSVLDKVVSRDIAEEMLRGEIKLGGETRPVTTLFADIRGFTALTEGMPPERVIALLNEVMDAAAQAVDAEGGVVDKYVGDELMAVFGAPISGDDDARRAVRAALRIQEAVSDLNRGREARGDAPIGVGIGINTGPAVAGNMGSHDRLNYTVLGESVNLAARLCGRARAGEVLVSDATLDQAGDGFVTRALEPVRVKGISYSISVHEVRGERRAQSRVTSAALALSVALALVAGPLGWARPSHAQMPTLAEAGAYLVSPSGDYRLDLSGMLLLDVYEPGRDGAGFIFEDDTFLAGRLSLFLDATLGPYVDAAVELRADRGETPSDQGVTGRIEQAFVVIKPWKDRRFDIQIGRFLSPFGGWPRRHDTRADAFIRPPLPYDYRTMICPLVPPPNVEKFLNWKHVPERFRPTGSPVVWGAPYQKGAMVSWRTGGLTARVAVLGTAPSSEPYDWGYWPGEEFDPSWVGDLSYRFSHSFQMVVSCSVGPYLQTTIEPRLREGRSLDDYEQSIWSVYGSWTRGWTQLKIELLIDSWDVPNVYEKVEDDSAIVEIKQKVSPGWWLAARWSTIRFSELSTMYGGDNAWDWDIERWEIAFGWAPSRNLELRFESMWNSQKGPYEPDDDLLALQLKWLF